MPDRRHLAGRHGCVLLDAAGRIVDFEEKPERPKSNIASLAVYVLTPAAQELLDDYLRGGGTPESYAEAQRAFQAVQDRTPR